MLNQKGFTLVELMVALTLGLLISAAALQLFLTAQKNTVSQQGLINLQGSSIFGLESIVRDIRQANLLAEQPYMDDKTPSGGIVLTAFNLSTNYTEDGGKKVLNFSIDDGLLSKGGGGDSNLTGLKSDQLVVQYRVNEPNHFDCEGKAIPLKTYVVQRFFLREDTNLQDNEPNKPLALACKATRYIEEDKSTKSTLDGLSGDGQIVIPRVDHFRVLLGVAKDGMNSSCSEQATADATLDCFGYIDLENYKKLTVKPQIVSVKLAVLVRSSESVGSDEFYDENKKFSLLDQTASLIKDDNNKRYLRSVMSQTIALRNGFGIEK